MSKSEAKSELRWVLLWAAAVVLISSVPYIFGATITPKGEHFLGLTHNIDDGAVYLSWMRQAADGHFFIRNLFASEPQVGMQFNVLTLAMGNLGRVSHLPLIWVFHVFRVALGVLLMVVIWRFAKLFLPEPAQRRYLMPLVAFSSGIGWLLPASMQGPPNGSVDMWQPEAITFLAIYLNPLFAAALILMVCAFRELVLAEREGSVRRAVYAGLWLLLLGNVHTYDVITVACVWAAYLIVLTVAKRRFPTRAVLLSLLAGVIASPSVAYQLWLYHADKVLYARANSPIWSPPVWSFFTGYGLVLIGALICILLVLRKRRPFPSFNIQHSSFIILWSVVGFAVPYIPLAQQRKLVMGLHIPLCILCAYLAAHVLSRFRREIAGILFALVCLLASESNLLFMSRDMGLLAAGGTVTHYTPYLTSDEMAAMRWLRENTKWDDTVYAAPTFALFVPALIGHQVYYGHWSETPGYSGKVLQWMDLSEAVRASELPLGALRTVRAHYYVLPFVPKAGASAGSSLRRVFTHGTVAIYQARAQ